MSDHKHHHHEHGEHCDHDHDHEHDHKVTLVDENGEEKVFDIVTWFEVDAKEYVVLIAEDDTEGQEGVILRVEEEEGEEFLVDIEDEEEWNKVLETYEKMLQEEA